MTKITNEYLNKKLPGYKGNSLLKKVGQKIPWNRDLIDEYMKCSKDVVYFTETYMKIISKTGIVNFELYPYQKKMLKMFAKNKHNIVTTARQAGKCFFSKTKIKIRNKETQEEKEITIEEFIEIIKNNSNCN